MQNMFHLLQFTGQPGHLPQNGAERRYDLMCATLGWSRLTKKRSSSARTRNVLNCLKAEESQKFSM